MVSPGGVEVSQTIAGIGGRSLGYIIDWHIRLLVSAAWFFVLVIVLGGGIHSEAFTDAFDAKWAAGVIFYPILIFNLLYHLVLEIVMNGRTPGKRMAGVRIVAKTGMTASAGAIVIRNILRLIDFLPAYYILGVIVAMFHKQHCRIGDLAAGTVLIYEPKTRQRDVHWIGQNTTKGLTAQQFELMNELLTRWRSLDMDTRMQLACQMIIQADQTPVQEGSGRKLDKRLHQQLKALVKGDLKG